MKVVTYQLAYGPGRVSVCADCVSRESFWDALAWTLPPLGPVDRGEHWGNCDNCENLYRREVRGIRRSEFAED
jgi:hypothetical protein